MLRYLIFLWPFTATAHEGHTTQRKGDPLGYTIYCESPHSWDVYATEGLTAFTALPDKKCWRYPQPRPAILAEWLSGHYPGKHFGNPSGKYSVWRAMDMLSGETVYLLTNDARGKHKPDTEI